MTTNDLNDFPARPTAAIAAIWASAPSIEQVEVMRQAEDPNTRSAFLAWQAADEQEQVLLAEHERLVAEHSRAFDAWLAATLPARLLALV